MTRDEKRRELIKVAKRDPEAIVDLVLDLMDQVTALTSRVSEPENQIKKNSRNSSKPPSSDKGPKPKSLRSKNGKKKNGGQAGHSGHNLEMSKNPDEKIDLKLTACPITGEILSDEDIIDVVRKQVFELPEPRLQITEYCTYIYQNSNGDLVSRTDADFLKSNVQYGKNFNSWLVYLHDFQMLPLNRIRQLAKDLYGVSISEGTILLARETLNERLDGFEIRLKERLQKSKVVHADETGFKVNGKQNWLHTVCNQNFTFLGVHKKRGYDAIRDFGILENFNGALMHDCLGMYFKLENCKHLLCNPHLLRELVFCHEELSQKWAKQMIDFLWKCYEIRKQESGNIDNTDVLHRQYKEIINLGYKENPKSETTHRKKGKRGRSRQSKPLNLLDRLQKHQSKILRFLDDPELPFSNNLAEQAVRMTKVKQKISGGFRKFESAQTFARIRSFTATAQKQGISVFDAISNLFQDPDYLYLSP